MSVMSATFDPAAATGAAEAILRATPLMSATFDPATAATGAAAGGGKEFAPPPPPHAEIMVAIRDAPSKRQPMLCIFALPP
jgi:hypothetical protein